MIRISSLKLKPGHSYEDIINAVSKKLRLNPFEIEKLEIIKKSLDARDKSDIHWNYSVDISLKNEAEILKGFKNNRNINKSDKKQYVLPQRGNMPLKCRPCIVGSGPCGLFAAYFLAKEGYRPVLVEQGQCVEERIKTVETFWESGKLNPLSNIQFGEGGAGTFSDGKLNTGINDKNKRNRLVLETFVENGAPEKILYENKPHIGTDILCTVVANMRNKIISRHGEVLFNTKFIDFAQKDGKVVSIALQRENEIFIKPCSVLIISAGHSSRETFYMLKESGLNITAKSFAVGIRAEHLQEDINRAMYGSSYRELYGDSLPAADYKLTYRTKDNRGVYSFCMCPGGYVVNSSSEDGGLCVNGMSYSGRRGSNANSAIIVTVNPEDTGADIDPMKGVEFQRELERNAYIEGSGLIPVQTFKCFKEGKTSLNLPDNPSPQTKGGTSPADINKILPRYICDDIKEAFSDFGRKIPGYDADNTVLSAVESRTSSPLRILRDEHFESNIKGIFPAGEGAGYSGGITSSAIDGIKVFEEIYRRYAPR